MKMASASKVKLERIGALAEEASELRAMLAHVDEKVAFLASHHAELGAKKKTFEVKLGEARQMGRETAAQHFLAEISLLGSVMGDNNQKIKDMQREAYFISLERKRKVGTVQKLKLEVEESKRRAALQKK
ncbi:hypothetical protein B484DRAFT_429748, partial [Ochromonadaceae sp. CCMP2298]